MLLRLDVMIDYRLVLHCNPDHRICLSGLDVKEVLMMATFSTIMADKLAVNGVDVGVYNL